MNKELEALEQLSKLVFVYGGVEQYKIIENALKDYEKQDNIINIIKETIEFDIQEPEMEVKENGNISLLNRVGMSIRKQLNEKERKLFREWVLKECFPKELKALEIIKKIFQYDVEVNGNEIFEEEYEPNEVITKEEYDLLREVLL